LNPLPPASFVCLLGRISEYVAQNRVREVAGCS
jgi:hypothetical protein